MIAASDATHRQGIGAWATVFGDGRAATGAGLTIGINDAELRAADLGLAVGVSDLALTLLTDSASLLQAWEHGTGALTEWDVWREFTDRLRVLPYKPEIRRAHTLDELELHQQAHNLASAAWLAAQHGEDAANVADQGWRDGSLSNDEVCVLHTRRGIELLISNVPDQKIQIAIDYEVARLSDDAQFIRISCQHFVFAPKRRAAHVTMQSIRRLVSDFRYK